MAVTRKVRRVFQLLRRIGSALHADLGVNASQRAVMESLIREGPKTVPALARMRPVSRQHIQLVVNQLIANGLLKMRPNPEHKRSTFVTLTSRGEKMLKTMMSREVILWRQLVVDLNDKDLASMYVGVERLEMQVARFLPELGASDDLEDEA